MALRAQEDDSMTDVGALELAKSPHLGGLSRLHVPKARLSPDALLALQARFPEALT